ncbi:MAG: murein biosynthesis integral membrane protein MurJ, partial [Paraclostridium sp.]
VLASAYGTSAYSDAYLISLNIPIVIFTAIGTALGTTFIPLYYENENIYGKDKAIKYTNNVINIVSILCITLSIVAVIFVEDLVKVFAIGFEGETLDITISFTRILLYGVIFISISEVMKGYLNANNNFAIPAIMTGIPYNIIIMISILISVELDPYFLAIGTLLAMSSRIIFQLPYMYKYGYRYKLTLDLKDDSIKKMIFLLGPVFIGVAVNQINTMIDRSLASTLVEGSISALNYSNRLNEFVRGLFILSIGTVIYPMLSKLSSNNDKEEFVNSISKSISSVILLVIPISIGAMVLAKPIVSLLFERGAFDARATEMTSIALVFYSIGMIGFGLRDILGKVFYSLQDTKTPMINGAMAMGLNIVLNLILVRFMGHAGLAFATSISAIICIFLLFNSLKKKIGYYGQDKIRKTMIKSLIAAIGMGVITIISYKLLASVLGLGFIQEAIALFGSIGVGAIVYAGLVILLKVEEVNVIVNMIRNKLNLNK